MGAAVLAMIGRLALAAVICVALFGPTCASDEAYRIVPEESFKEAPEALFGSTPEPTPTELKAVPKAASQVAPQVALKATVPAHHASGNQPDHVITAAEVAAAKKHAAGPDGSCELDVNRCFAQMRHTSKPVWKKPVSDFSGSYKLMCTSEIKAKLAEKAKKKNLEVNHKALCKKEELDQKYTERKLKLSVKKEKYSKSMSEEKNKYLEKKLKHARETTVKTAGKGKEFAEKLSEKSNKREDVLYKKECASKESAFKSVREGKQKMRIVYVDKTKAPKAKPKPVVVKPVVVKPVVVKPVVVKPKPVVVKPKPVVVKPAPVVKPKKKNRISSLKEILLKTGEKSDKAQLKSHELMSKSNNQGKLAVAKEALVKAHEMKGKHEKASKDHTKEKACKEKDSKEDSGKIESKTKLKIDRMRLEAAKKEAKIKIVKPTKKKPCNPVTALEVYVKNCKKQEELFGKAKINHENEIKEIRNKDKIHEQNRVCSLVHEACRQIYSVSQVREDRIVKLVTDHTAELEAQMAKTRKYQEAEANKMKFQICESAAKDMKYFVNKLLFTVPQLPDNTAPSNAGNAVPLRLATPVTPAA